VGPGSVKPDFALISYGTLAPDAEERIRHFQKWVHETFGVHIRAVSGGYGCTRIEFEVVAESPEQAAQFTLAMVNDPELHKKAQEIGFRVLIVTQPYARIDLANGRIEGGAAVRDLVKQGGIHMTKDQSTHITAPVTNSAIAVHSPDAKQDVTVNPQLDAMIAAIVDKARSDGQVTKEQYAQVVSDIDDLKKELALPKPRRSVVERLIGNLGGVASLTSLANQMVPFLPALV